MCASGQKVVVHRDDAFELRAPAAPLDSSGPEPRRDTFELALIERILLGGRAI